MDIDNDWLRVRYDPAKVAPQQMLQTAAKQDYTAKIVDGAKAPPP